MDQILGAPTLALGAARCGAVLQTAQCTQTKQHKKWGWVPTTIAATTAVSMVPTAVQQRQPRWRQRGRRRSGGRAWTAWPRTNRSRATASFTPPASASAPSSGFFSGESSLFCSAGMLLSCGHGCPLKSASGFRRRRRRSSSVCGCGGTTGSAVRLFRRRSQRMGTLGLPRLQPRLFP